MGDAQLPARMAVTESKEQNVKRTVIGIFGALLVALAGASLAGPVNVNSADARTLAKELDGIGYARAQAIVKWRRDNGRFESADDLRNVKGVGKKIIDMNRSNIRLDDPQAAD
ncbi:MAG: helix-hairpin-helix domain-containing protein [Gammaproteobacteria bacterium]|nr:helix-hairpin-helix domain-containing protein [Gammaproteobacteria bacterium]